MKFEWYYIGRLTALIYSMSRSIDAVLETLVLFQLSPICTCMTMSPRQQFTRLHIPPETAHLQQLINCGGSGNTQQSSLQSLGDLCAMLWLLQAVWCVPVGVEWRGEKQPTVLGVRQTPTPLFNSGAIPIVSVWCKCCYSVTNWNTTFPVPHGERSPNKDFHARWWEERSVVVASLKIEAFSVI